MKKTDAWMGGGKGRETDSERNKGIKTVSCEKKERCMEGGREGDQSGGPQASESC